MADPGRWLAERRWEMDRGESGWLEALASFDRDGGWAADGQLSCAEWLMWRTEMARATAFEKLRIAHQLRARPSVAHAFADGRLSYSAVRAITRIDDPDPDVDAALIDAAAAGTVADVERAVHCYQLHADQHCDPLDAWDRRGVRIIPGYGGTGRVEITLSAIEVEEFTAALQALIDLARRPAEPVNESSSDSPDSPDPAEVVDGPVDESSAGDSAFAAGLACGPGYRADAFMDLVRLGLAHAADGHAAGADRYLVHLINRPDGATTLADSSPLDPATAATVACDASTVSHHFSAGGEPLDQGRKTRTWSTAQRRAALVRDGGHCRFPGCQRRIADLHHQRPWAAGGATDLDNGFLVCPRHHSLLHHSYHTTGNPNGPLTFTRPDGTTIGTTGPTTRTSTTTTSTWPVQ